MVAGNLTELVTESLRRIAEALDALADLAAASPPIEPPVTVTEAAALLGVTEATIRRWLRAGTLPGVRVAGTWRIPRHAITAITHDAGATP